MVTDLCNTYIEQLLDKSYTTKLNWIKLSENLYCLKNEFATIEIGKKLDLSTDRFIFSFSYVNLVNKNRLDANINHLHISYRKIESLYKSAEIISSNINEEILSFIDKL